MKKLIFIAALLMALLCVFAAMASSSGKITLAVGDTITACHNVSRLSNYTYTFRWEIRSGEDCIQIVSGADTDTCIVRMLKEGSASLRCICTAKRGSYSSNELYDISFTIVSKDKKTVELSGKAGEELNIAHYMFSSNSGNGDIASNLSYEWIILSGPVHFKYDKDAASRTGETSTPFLDQDFVLDAPGTARVQATVWQTEYPQTKYIYTAVIHIDPPDIPAAKTEAVSVQMDYSVSPKHYVEDSLSSLDISLNMEYEWKIIFGDQYIHFLWDSQNSWMPSIYADSQGKAVIQGTATIAGTDCRYVHTVSIDIQPPNYPEFIGTATCTKCGGHGDLPCTSNYCAAGTCSYCGGSGYTYNGKKCSFCSGKGFCQRCKGTGWMTCSKCNGDGTQDPNPVSPVAWNDPTYSWNSDHTRVTATRTGRDDQSLRETETVLATAKVTAAPTCTEKGKKTYTSGTFENAAFAVQTVTEVIPALGHTWTVKSSKPATDIADGVRGGVVCGVCGSVKTADRTISRRNVFRLPAGVHTINAEAFLGTAANQVTIPDGTVSIESRAFADSGVLLAVIPYSVTFIADDAFAGCDLAVICPEWSYAAGWCSSHHIQHDAGD